MSRQLFRELDKIDYSCSTMTVDAKSDDSFVTNVDYQANETIETFFNTLYGEEQVTIISEENSNTFNDETKYNIVVDPIDGTENLVNGVPIFGVSISIYKYGISHYHILYFPLMKEYITSDMKHVERSKRESRLILLSSNVSLDAVQHLKAYENKEYRLYGCATYNMYSVIMNKAYMYTNHKANSYDILAGINIANDIEGIEVFINDRPYCGEFLMRDNTYKLVMKWR